MQILRIILMVCFVFTAYTPIGEAVDIEAVDISKGSKTKSSSRAELPLGVEDVGAFESKENQGGSPVITLEGTEPVELEAGFNYEAAGATADGSNIDWRDTERLGKKKSPATPPEHHLNERILQLQKKSLATPTED